MRRLTVGEVLDIHRAVAQQSGGAVGIRDVGALESSVAQPHMTFGGADLYPSFVDKAAALGFFLVRNHPFIDGNKRTGHAAMEVFLLLNGFEIRASVVEQVEVMLEIASGRLSRESFTAWLGSHIEPR